MKFLALFNFCCVLVLSLSVASWAQSTKPDFTGDWYKIEYLSTPPLKVVNVKSVNGKYHVRMYNKDWALVRTGNRLFSSKFATAAEIQQQVQNSDMSRMPMQMAAQAAKQHAFKFYLSLELGKDGQSFSEIFRFTGQSYIYNGKLVKFYDLNPVFTLIWKRKPPLSASYDWAKYVRNNKGIVDFPFREMYKAEIAATGRSHNTLASQSQEKIGSLIWLAGNYKQGHQYFAVNSLGRSKISPKGVMDILKTEIEKIFPDEARGLNGSVIMSGRRFELQVNNLLINNRFEKAVVQAKNIGDFDFTFETVIGQHPLRGDATFGVFKDSNGELFLFHQGVGPSDEGWFRTWLNYTVPSTLWRRMADNLKLRISQPASSATTN